MSQDRTPIWVERLRKTDRNCDHCPRRAAYRVTHGTQQQHVCHKHEGHYPLFREPTPPHHNP